MLLTPIVREPGHRVVGLALQLLQEISVALVELESRLHYCNSVF